MATTKKSVKKSFSHIRDTKNTHVFQNDANERDSFYLQKHEVTEAFGTVPAAIEIEITSK